MDLSFEKLDNDLSAEIFHDIVTTPRTTGWKQLAFHAETHARLAHFDRLMIESSVGSIQSKEAQSDEDRGALLYQEKRIEQLKARHDRLTTIALGAEVLEAERSSLWMPLQHSLFLADVYGRITATVGRALQDEYRIDRDKDKMMAGGVVTGTEIEKARRGLRRRTHVWVSEMQRRLDVHPSDDAVRVVLIDKFPILDMSRYDDVTTYLSAPHADVMDQFERLVRHSGIRLQ